MFSTLVRLSTAHLFSNELLAKDFAPCVIQRFKDVILVHVDVDVSDKKAIAHFLIDVPEWLRPIVKYAIRFDCEYILFDPNGETVSMLPTYANTYEDNYIENTTDEYGEAK